MNQFSVPENDNRLRWKCRRGMLELDILLQSFLENGYEKLDPTDIARFTQLLEYEDNPLFELLMGRMQPADPSLGNLLSMIRSSAKN